ncbi:hypothetical protein ACP4OV_005068 [Aristida adscensionis]
MQQPVSRSAPARPRAPCGSFTGGPRAPGHAVAAVGACQVRVRTTGRGAAGFGLRACGGAEPVDVEARRGKEAEVELVAEELEVLEEAAIAGEDDGRRPMVYDRRAHIFEESSRVFRELKQRRDSDGYADGGCGQDGATAAKATAREQQKLG